MDKSILAALIGATTALLVNFISTLRSKKREKVQLISEIIGYLLNQKRYSKRFVGHKLWLNYYNRLNRIIKDNDQRCLINDKIENRIKYIEEIELRLIDSDTCLLTLSSKYRSFYPKDKFFFKSIENIRNYTIIEHVQIEDFRDYSTEKITASGINDEINDYLKESFSELDKSLFTYIDNLIIELTKKIS